PSTLESDQPQLDLDREWHVYRRLLQLSGDPLLGLKLGQAYRMESYGVLGYAMLSAATLGDAVRLAADFDLLTYTHFKVELKVNKQRASLLLHRPDYLPKDLLQLYEDRELAAVLTAAEQALGLPMAAQQVAMMHAAYDHDEAYHRFFGCTVNFEQPHTELAFDASLLDAPMPQRDAETSRFCRQQCAQLLATLSRASSFVDTVRSLLIAQPTRFASVEALAEKLGMSVRSLRRKLSAEGSSYRTLLDEIRYQLAREYLQSRLTLEQIADLLGYSEASNFSHAFKRWHGGSPQDYRDSFSDKA
ncbi:MAG: AraC family transcriptional regulator, partial [Oleiphilaceae bacterium]|nr:AraC family transcriptional regulator [Oleiphilaceae bacterium]